jgi:hypothetical protein
MALLSRDQSPPASASPEPSPPAASSPELGQETAAGQTQLPLVHTQLVAIPPSTVVPSQAGLSDCNVYGHSSESPLHEPPGVTADAAGQVPTSLQAPRATANAAHTAKIALFIVVAAPVRV